MKKTNICPKCKSNNILKIKGDLFKNRNFIYNGYFKSGTHVDNYVCSSCGFMESWLDEKSINKI